MTHSSEVQSIIMVGHGGIQADVVLKKELRTLHLDPRQQEVVWNTRCGMSVYEVSKPIPAVTHFPQ